MPTSLLGGGGELLENTNTYHIFSPGIQIQNTKYTCDTGQTRNKLLEQWKINTNTKYTCDTGQTRNKLLL